MLAFGHLGIGLKLSRFIRPAVPAFPILVGTVLPDLVDKPLYYGISLITGKVSTEIGLISCTRTFGHTGLFGLLLLMMSFVARKKAHRIFLVSVACGVFSHHFLDLFQDAFISEKPFLDGAETQAFLYPFYKNFFAPMPTKNVTEHIMNFLNAPMLFLAEFVGCVILFQEWKKRKNLGA